MTAIFSEDAPLKIGIVVGEASGDLLGVHLMQAILAVEPDAKFAGIGGARMKTLGFKSLYSQEELAVRGLLEVVKKLPKLFRIRRGVYQQLKKSKLDVFIGIDAPDFNLTLESWFKKNHTPTIHYVSPSVWAWRKERIHKIVKQVNTVLCLFPMEPPLYHNAGGEALFVGHPLARTIPLKTDKLAMRETLRLPLALPIFTLMPGSRISEIDFMAPIFLKAARLILQELPDAKFLVPLSTLPSMNRFREVVSKEKAHDIPLQILNGHAQMAVIASDVILAKSGTSTLEVALCKRPMVISYRITTLTYLWVKRKIKSAFVGLPNILLGYEAVPELLQKDATPEKLAKAVLMWYDDKEKQNQLQESFLALHESLLADTNQLVADAVLKAAKYPCK